MRVEFQPYWERVFWNPDDGGGSGGGSGEGETFTKEQVEQLIVGRLAKTKAENTALKNQISELQGTAAKVAELEAKLLEMKGKAPGDPLPSDVEGKLKLLESKHSNELKALTDKMANLEKERETERTRRMQVERDNELSQALREAGCRPDAEEVGSAYFKNQISYDQDDGRWVFSLRKGGTCSVKEGVAEELPDYLKEPTMRNGGSGSPSGGKGTAKVKALDEAKAKLETLKTAAQSGRDDDLLKYQQQKRVVGQLELELART